MLILNFSRPDRIRWQKFSTIWFCDVFFVKWNVIVSTIFFHWCVWMCLCDESKQKRIFIQPTREIILIQKSNLFDTSLEIYCCWNYLCLNIQQHGKQNVKPKFERKYWNSQPNSPISKYDFSFNSVVSTCFRTFLVRSTIRTNATPFRCSQGTIVKM